MFKKFIQLSALAATATEAKENSAEDHWAVIVVGSSGWFNYRHHADACHAYHQTIANGIPADQVIMVAFDDVANNEFNPFDGKIFNKPTPKGVKGVDVYKGCKIDYRAKDANKETVLGILQGDSSVGDKVLKSNQNSKVFFYYVDHGAPGLVSMPVGKNLFANELNKAVEYMHENKMFKEMVMYFEACESGSIFENILKTDINVYAVSAANSKESSWGTYCHPDDKVEGEHMGTCLGDLFSVSWMEDLDKAMKKKKLGVETLDTQYDIVKQETNRSHVLQWGDVSIASEAIGEFEAGDYTAPKSAWSAFKSAGKAYLKDKLGYTTAEVSKKNDFAVGVRDIKLHYLYSRVVTDPSIENQQALMAELQQRLHTDQTFQTLFPQFYEWTNQKEYPLPTTEADFECYSNLIDLFTDACGETDTYAMKHFGNFLHQCQAIKYNPAALDEFKTKLEATCPKTA